MKRLIIIILILALPFCTTFAQTRNNRNVENANDVIDTFKSLTKSTKWELVETIKQNFRTYHPQGMVKIGDFFYLSSVETIAKPKKFDTPQNGFDRTPGKGIGHLFKIDGNGNLIDQITLGETTIYHPGGFDFDGRYLWVPVAEYRPNSRSIIYRVDPENLKATEMFRFNDHIGGLVYNREDHSLVGVSWGSRRFYVWTQEQMNEATLTGDTPKYSRKLNGSHYIDYQDCHYIGEGCMLCSGLSHYSIKGKGKIALGGLELISLVDLQAKHQIPFYVHIKPELVLTNNPFWFEIDDGRLRFYFMPEDDESYLYIYEAEAVQ